MKHFIQKLSKIKNSFTKKTKVKSVYFADGVKDAILDDKEDTQVNREDLNECPICFKEYHFDQDCSLDNCIHAMCLDCMSSMYNEHRQQCPLCMKPFSNADFSRMKGVFHIMSSKNRSKKTM
ncbi:hypothetical protein QKU58_gp009 [Pyramimonas orientalis virus]|uniref:RING-type domain-containing protein n=1 Tax=Pyramimonas orientalis virus 01B TaxID=3134525 RepID=A0A7M4CEP5_9VIRU|nr:hypothetical protein QKU58_gp009 [Pyramimonas orientalis virus]QOI90147.1 hypothetical protein HWQ62_00009 [Pyramimonas orientalis virus]